MKKEIYVLLLVLVFLVPVSTWSQLKTESLFDEDQLIERLQELSSDAYEGRKTGEKGNTLARNFIISKFKELGVQPINSVFEQHFDFKKKKNKYEGVNVLGKIKGSHFPEKYIVISAHYDHLGVKDGKIYNGADDDASGICALFAFAEYFKQNPPKHSVILAAFDAEEMGLQGSKFFVKKPIVGRNAIVLNINMDMIGRNVDNELYVVGGKYSEKLQEILEKFKHSTSIKLLQGHDGSDGKYDWTLSSDHGPFHLQKIPFLYFGEEDHPDYHKETDEFENIDPKYYKETVRLIVEVFNDIDKNWEKK